MYARRQVDKVILGWRRQTQGHTRSARRTVKRLQEPRRPGSRDAGSRTHASHQPLPAAHLQCTAPTVLPIALAPRPSTPDAPDRAWHRAGTPAAPGLPYPQPSRRRHTKRPAIPRPPSGPSHAPSLQSQTLACCPPPRPPTSPAAPRLRRGPLPPRLAARNRAARPIRSGPPATRSIPVEPSCQYRTATQPPSAAHGGLGAPPRPRPWRPAPPPGPAAPPWDWDWDWDWDW